MNKRLGNNKGFGSILEVTITAIVFSVAAVGLMTTITMVRPESTTSSKRLEAAYIGKQLIDDLRKDVSAETWYLGNTDDPLLPGTYTDSVTQDGVQYNYTYTIQQVNPYGDFDARKLTITIEYPDP